jgi:hypothetical protein
VRTQQLLVPPLASSVEVGSGIASYNAKKLNEERGEKGRTETNHVIDREDPCPPL